MFGLGKKMSGLRKKKKKADDKRKKEEMIKEEKELQRDLSLIDDKILDDIPYRLSGNTKSLKTGIDGLYSLIRDKKNMTAAKAAKSLKVKENIIVEWARIMEEHEMLRIHYPVFGKPSLRSMDWKPKWKKKREKKKKGKGKEKSIGKRFKHLKFTKRRLFIIAEMIILGEILISDICIPRKQESWNKLLTDHHRETELYLPLS